LISLHCIFCHCPLPVRQKSEGIDQYVLVNYHFEQRVGSVKK
jgi:hypothetical protein